jgi:threonine/homoserine/homoserine lactone efflux protein
MLSYALAVIILMTIPGPALLTIFGIGAAFGYRAGIQYVIGVYIGANLITLIVFSGLSTLLLEFPGLRSTLFILSLVYFTYLAARIALAGSELGIVKQSPPGCWAGVMLQLVNPKAYMTISALYLGFPIFSNTPVSEAFIKIIIANIIWIPGHLLWLYAGVRVNRLNLSERTTRLLNISLAATMLIIVFVSAILSIFG